MIIEDEWISVSAGTAVKELIKELAELQPDKVIINLHTNQAIELQAE